MVRSANADTLEKFRFGMAWDSNDNPASLLVRAGFHDIQMPKRSTNKINYREGTDPAIYSVSAGITSMEDIVVSRGMMPYGQQQEMFAWSDTVHKANDTSSSLAYDVATLPPTGADAPSVDYRKNVWIWMYHRDGTIARAWMLFNAFPSSFAPGGDLNASEDGEKSLESLTLAYEDFRELEVVAGVITGITITV